MYEIIAEKLNEVANEPYSECYVTLSTGRQYLVESSSFMGIYEDVFEFADGEGAHCIPYCSIVDVLTARQRH